MPKKIAKLIRESFLVDRMSPEEYAGRFSHKIALLGYEYKDHEDDDLDQWLLELRDIIDDETRLQAAREKYLTPEEISVIVQESQPNLHFVFFEPPF